jgi:hypothetical protein
MLKFFRTIRKKLIEEDNVRKYLLYAVGEILLVVIGILIALQVHNWNEGTKDKARMLTNIHSIQEDIQLETRLIAELINRLRFQVEAYESVVPVMESGNRTVQDSLKFILDFNWLTDTPIISTRSNTWDFLNTSGAIAEFPDSELLRMLQHYYDAFEQTAINFTNTAIPSRLELRKLKYELFTDTEHRKFFPTVTPKAPGKMVYDSIFNDPRILPLCRYIGTTAMYFENEFISVQKISNDLNDYLNKNYR